MVLFGFLLFVAGMVFLYAGLRNPTGGLSGIAKGLAQGQMP
jgi:hypothetical protein